MRSCAAHVLKAGEFLRDKAGHGVYILTLYHQQKIIGPRYKITAGNLGEWIYAFGNFIKPQVFLGSDINFN